MNIMTKTTLAILTAVAILSVSGSAQPAAAIEYPWCAQYSGGEEGGGGRNCGFVSRDQCMLTVQGMGGSCEPNLFYLDQVTRKPQPPARRRERER